MASNASMTEMEILFPIISSTGLTHDLAVPSGHSCIAMAQIMGEFHNSLIRAYNAAYTAAAHISPTTSSARDIAGLLLYVQIIVEISHIHHDWEEKNYFPLIAEVAGDTETHGWEEESVDEHRAFGEQLTELEDFTIAAGRDKGQEFDGPKLRELMEALRPTLGKHFANEPSRFYALKDLDSGKLKVAFEKASRLAMEKNDPFRVAPLILGCQDIDHRVNGEGNSLTHDVPFFVPYLTRYVFSWRYADAWKYNPRDEWGRPRKLFWDT